VNTRFEKAIERLKVKNKEILDEEIESITDSSTATY
jgi:hypothetical protein